MLCLRHGPRSISGLPNREDVKQGVIAYKIAAHLGRRLLAIAKERQDRDKCVISRARFAFDWNEQFSSPRSTRKQPVPITTRPCHKIPFKIGPTFCSMCGPKYCSMKIHRRHSQDGTARGSWWRSRPAQGVMG